MKLLDQHQCMKLKWDLDLDMHLEGVLGVGNEVMGRGASSLHS